ncbi:hypothetical protein C8J56DRAFT_16658 [Mycena floridula]|nr:hypothetical protein C8J56DRAFT_16658 [Mycena floridula]
MSGRHPYRSVPLRSRRNVRGAGWHRRGYRDAGCMWINVKLGSYGHVRGQDVQEDMSINDFWNQVIRGIEMEDGFPLPAGWTFGLYSRRKLLEQSDTERIDTIFDGGETVTVKIFDEEDQERVYTYGEGWGYHVPGRPARRSQDDTEEYYRYLIENDL